MFTVYVAHQGGLRKQEAAEPFATAPVWIDMAHPTPAEEDAVEAALGIDVPTHAEMQEIELSSRLYREKDALFMTATLLMRTDTERPEANPVTFVLAAGCLVTIRYSEPRTFPIFAARAQRAGSGMISPEGVLLGLLDAIIDRAADVLERLSVDVDGLSQAILQNQAGQPTPGRDFHDILRTIGAKGDFNSKARESLVSIGRLLTFLPLDIDQPKGGREPAVRLDTLRRDVSSLTDHSSFLSNKITFLLDATLGMINIEQNAIIKIFSVVAVMLLPPTLIASIYGMNFDAMPELGWPWGYPFALVLMALSGFASYWLFKRRGWL